MIKRRNINLRRERQAAAAMMTVEDLAATLGIGRNQAYGMVKREQVKAMRIGRRWLIPRAEVAKLTAVDTTMTIERPTERTMNIPNLDAMKDDELRRLLEEVRTLQNELRVNSAMVHRLNDAVVVQGRILDGIRQFMTAYTDWKAKP